MKAIEVSLETGAPVRVEDILSQFSLAKLVDVNVL